VEFSFQVDAESALPLHAQLERRIRQAVVIGTLSIGDQLPTVRELAVALRINANTVAKVYRELEHEGLLETRRGVGTFIARLEKQPTKRERDRRMSEIIADLLARIQMEGISLAEILEELESIDTKSK
jgi:GntR family transcriptional regulator